MPRRVDDFRQPKLGHTAGDLGEEAYRANLADQSGRDDSRAGDPAGVVPAWKRPEPRNALPGQERKDAQEIKLGQDWKLHEK